MENPKQLLNTLNFTLILTGLTLSIGYAKDLRKVDENGPEFNGILVRYRDLKAKETSSKGLHKKLNAILKYESSTFPIVWVTLLSSLDNNNRRKLQALCENYLRQPGIVHCALNRRSEPDPRGAGNNEAEINTFTRLTQQIDAKLAPVNMICDSEEQEAKVPFRCPLYETYEGKAAPLLDGKLSPFWAQEYIGADLTLEFVKGEFTNGKLPSIPVSVWDTGLDSKALPRTKEPGIYIGSKRGEPGHGTAVSNLIVGDPPLGVSPVAAFHSFARTDNTASFMEAIDSISRLSDLKRPKIVNRSLGLPEEDPASNKLETDLINKIADNTLFVTSAGNKYPTKVISNKEEAKNAILVGNLSPIGLMSATSSEGENVAIAAPADDYIQSIRDSSKTPSNFSGTSAASPLVTGSLANALAFIPDLKPQEARLLLSKTAVLSANSLESPIRRNGAGMLNSYLLARVAKRLSADATWLKLPPGARLAALEDPRWFDFSEEANENSRAAQELLRSRDESSRPEQQCHLDQMALKKLRKALLLQPSSPDLQNVAGHLAKLYQRHGLEFNSLFYKSLIWPEGMRDVVLHALAGQPPKWTVGALRLLYGQSDRALPLLKGPELSKVIELPSLANKSTMLHFAGANNNVELFRTLSLHFPDELTRALRVKNSDSRTPLHTAAELMNLQIFKTLHKSGILSRLSQDLLRDVLNHEASGASFIDEVQTEDPELARNLLNLVGSKLME